MVKAALKKYFGYDNFREYQEDIVNSILEGKDTVAIMPTGAGKSLCYQLPGIISDGVTIVISPLISLMKDQVDYLESIGVNAIYLNSSLNATEYRERLSNIYNSKYKIIYVAPERLETEGFVNAINGMHNKCTHLVIDEAHCVSRWGHDFRPSYTRIIEFVNQLNIRPTISAFTATATEVVRDDIINVLELHKPTKFISGFDRENLEFRVYINENKDRFIIDYIAESPDDTGIIYCATRKDTEKLHKLLVTKGINASIYHAGLSDRDRTRAQDDFINDNVNVIVATNAFGMGIDKSNVRYVIHYNMPSDIESYYQEAGRAGRDGEPSTCILLYSQGDTAIQKFFIDEANLPEDRKAIEYKKLQAMESYCHTSQCLRKYILNYFADISATDNCGNCSVCNDVREEKDITTEAQMILSCIYRTNQRFGKNMIVDTLRGSKNKKLISFQLDKQNTYGLMKSYSKNEVDGIINKLIASDYIAKTEEQYPILKLTQSSIPVLKNLEQVYMKVYRIERKEKVDNDLINRLKNLRKELAIKEGYPPYVIFHDSTLNEIANRLPINISQLSKIKGIGESKLNKYGESLLLVINEYIKENGIIVEPEVVDDKEEPAKVEEKEKSYIISCNMFNEGHTVDEIAQKRGFTIPTIQKHLIDGYISSKEVNIDDLIQKEYEDDIYKLVSDAEWDGKLRSIKDELPTEVTYMSIHAVIAKYNIK